MPMKPMADAAHQVADPIRSAGPYPDGVDAIDEKLAADPDNAELWMQRGLLLSTGMFMREAVESYSKAIAIDPFNGILYRHRGHRHISCREYEQAAADFVVASRLIPENWDVWYHLGLSYYLMGEYEKAEKAYDRCYKLSDPKDNLANFCAVTDWRWRTLMRLGRKDEAAKLVEAIPDGVDKVAPTDDGGYALDCAMYKGLVGPEAIFADGEPAGKLELTICLYGLSNYYYVHGDMAKSNEVLDKCIAYAEKDQWCSFGYLAALADKKNRTEGMGYPAIRRYDRRPGCSRVVIHNGVAYFTGHVSPFAPTLREQTEGVCKRYDELFAQYGMKKENILMANAYIKDMSKFSEYDEVFKAWVGTDHAPAGVAVQAQPDQTSALGDNILVELALIVAVD